MSIINEALKKAQQELDRKSGGSSFAKLASKTPPSATPKTAPRKKRFATVAIFAIIFVAVALRIFLKPHAPEIAKTENLKPAKSISKVTDETVAIKRVRSAQRTLPRKRVTSEDDLMLNGIVYDEQKPLAIINQKILAEGESFGKIKVVKIHPTRVEIELDGKTSSLDLK